MIPYDSPSLIAKLLGAATLIAPSITSPPKMPPFPPPPRSWFPSTAPVMPVNITSTTSTTLSSTDTKLHGGQQHLPRPHHLPVLDIPEPLCFSESDRGTHSPDTPEVCLPNFQPECFRG
ncbi:hypothetical protein NC652_005042 [Populus alba x Populus x berolinensis]|nr:hypothetical protein NC652_005042 [Populus alba x Populus x berolinensis]